MTYAGMAHKKYQPAWLYGPEQELSDSITDQNSKYVHSIIYTKSKYPASSF